MRRGEASWFRYASEGPGGGKQPALIRGGHRVILGDRVAVDRDGWRDKTGIYRGKDHKHKPLRIKVQFQENGGALLMCSPAEVVAVVDEESVA
jgi:hypothetical protein